MLTLTASFIPHYTAAALLLVLAILDRCLLCRGRVKILSLSNRPPYLDKYCFSVRFHTQGALMFSQIEYHLRSKEDPTMVIVGKARTLDFAHQGENHETLLFDKAYVKSGTWDLCVIVTNQGSRINPFYMLFPQNHTITQEVRL